ncbi:MAG: universal stress protein [Bacteroidota bacterium]|nr:universal stress protein [Bacteroidota bacterium]
MKNILFPTDFSKSANHALEFAVYMAQMGNKSLNILNVYMTPKVSDEAVTDDVYKTQLAESKKNAHHNIQNLKEELAVRHPWLTVHTHIEYGFIAETILAYAENTQCNYIVMGTHGAKGFLDNILGSNTLAVIENAKIPVWAIPLQSKIEEIKTITYASDYEGDEIPIITQVLDFATLFEIDTHVIHIHEEYEPEITPSEQITDILKAHFEGKRITFRTINRKDAVEGLEQYIINQKPEVLALARHERGFWSNMFHRSFTKHFAHASKTPILILHKED